MTEFRSWGGKFLHLNSFGRVLTFECKFSQLVTKCVRTYINKTRNMNSPSSSSGADISSSDVLGTEIMNNDVLTGRGARIDNHPGNVAFREIVRLRQKEYTSTNRQQRKQEIAEEIINQISEQGGRFLRKVNESGVPSGADIWTTCDKVSILRKVKQVLRSHQISAPTLSSAVQESNDPATEPTMSSGDYSVSSALASETTVVQRALSLPGEYQLNDIQSLVRSNSSDSRWFQQMLQLQQIQDLVQPRRPLYSRDMASNLFSSQNSRNNLSFLLPQQFNWSPDPFPLNTLLLQSQLQFMPSSINSNLTPELLMLQRQIASLSSNQVMMDVLPGHFQAQGLSEGARLQFPSLPRPLINQILQPMSPTETSEEGPAETLSGLYLARQLELLNEERKANSPLPDTSSKVNTGEEAKTSKKRKVEGATESSDSSSLPSASKAFRGSNSLQNPDGKG